MRFLNENSTLLGLPGRPVDINKLRQHKNSYNRSTQLCIRRYQHPFIYSGAAQASLSLAWSLLKQYSSIGPIINSSHLPRAECIRHRNMTPRKTHITKKVSESTLHTKLYIPSSLNIDLILWQVKKSSCHHAHYARQCALFQL